jgi:hypothetical protein
MDLNQNVESIYAESYRLEAEWMDDDIFATVIDFDDHFVATHLKDFTFTEWSCDPVAIGSPQPSACYEPSTFTIEETYASDDEPGYGDWWRRIGRHREYRTAKVNITVQLVSAIAVDCQPSGNGWLVTYRAACREVCREYAHD